MGGLGIDGHQAGREGLPPAATTTTAAAVLACSWPGYMQLMPTHRQRQQAA